MKGIMQKRILIALTLAGVGIALTLLIIFNLTPKQQQLDYSSYIIQLADTWMVAESLPIVNTDNLSDGRLIMDNGEIQVSFLISNYVTPIGNAYTPEYYDLDEAHETFPVEGMEDALLYCKKNGDLYFSTCPLVSNNKIIINETEMYEEWKGELFGVNKSRVTLRSLNEDVTWGLNAENIQNGVRLISDIASAVQK